MMNPLIQFISIAVTVLIIALIGFAVYFVVMLICGTAGCIDWSDYEQINHEPAKNPPHELTIPQDRDVMYPPQEE